MINPLTSTITIGTRGSALALEQTALVAAALNQHGVTVTSKTIVTSGDRKQTAVNVLRDKKDWIRELEDELLSGGIDLAVHSGKDIPLDIAPGTELRPVLRRASPADVCILKPGTSSEHTFPPGSKIGTSSLRRKAQLLRLRPDLEIVEVRGNVPTRLRALSERAELTALVLAAAGLERLGLAPESSFPFTVEELLPAVNQGVLVVQFAAARTDIAALLQPLIDSETHLAWTAERACLRVLEADCNSACAIYAAVNTASHRPQLTLIARVLSPDGQETLEETAAGEMSLDAAEAVGSEVGEELLRRGAKQLLHLNPGSAPAGA